MRSGGSLVHIACKPFMGYNPITKHTKKELFSSLTSFFFELGTLRKVLRSHRQTLLTDDLSDNIASHSFRVTLIGWFLAKEESADPHKVLLMCLLHDLEETRSGDQNWVHKPYVKVYEEEISESQLKGLPFEQELKAVLSEYRERKTHEAIIAKDADLLDEILLLKEYSQLGNKEADRWLTMRAQKRALSTRAAQKLADALYHSHPNDWWDGIWSSQRR